ncbi:TPA: hypothetical protein I0766_002395 [Staphylococcus aureus]|nr:hypothetical protein [Staphylococcus aureus]
MRKSKFAIDRGYFYNQINKNKYVY